MHFVEDIDLVARTHRRVTDGIVDLTYVLDTVVRGRVHFQYVGMAAFNDRLAMDAHHRHIDGRFLHRTVRQFVIERTCKDACGGGLSDAAHAGEDPSLRDASTLECIRDGPHHGVLANKIVKACRPVFSREYAIALRRRFGRSGIGNSGFFRLAHRAIRFAAA